MTPATTSTSGAQTAAAKNTNTIQDVPEMFVLAASRHGQRKAGVELAPEKLLTFCAFSEEAVDPKLTSVVVGEGKKIISTNKNPILRPEAVAATNLKLHDSIFGTTMELVKKGVLPKILTLGGDHSIAIGSVSAISNIIEKALEERTPVEFKKPELIVFWVDAHADINTPTTTSSGNLHGCPVSLLAGLDKKGWAELGCFSWAKERLESVNTGRESFIQTSRVVYIGLRDVDEPEQETIDRLEMMEYPMTRFNKEGRNVCKVITDALKTIDPRGEHPIHLSFDIDALDPKYAPSTGTPVPGGLKIEEGVEIIKVLGETKRLVSMDLVEVNPSLGTSEDVEETLRSASKLIEQFHAV
ncbi:Arginase [Paramicrosporidium saccamoebae]|uniref:Arginase n=1 Tax=Paramicrosporidium saccamoebae TaxID=1246581 RepID=A0A2H9TPL4_9FUNG|nr:Arginase [Paramicrosporidium saccamoebae]